MHGYSTDSSERRIVPLLLALLAIALAWASSKFLATAHLSVPWWVDAPSSMAFYGALYALFDRYLWRNSLVHKLGLVRIPNLTGRWRGYLVTSFDGHATRYDLIIHVYQYQNQPLAYAMKTMHMHYGTAMLRISNGGCLAGDYYAGRDRRTFGRICCRRQLGSPNTDPESVVTVGRAKDSRSGGAGSLIAYKSRLGPGKP